MIINKNAKTFHTVGGIPTNPGFRMHWGIFALEFFREMCFRKAW